MQWRGGNASNANFSTDSDGRDLPVLCDARDEDIDGRRSSLKGTCNVWTQSKPYTCARSVLHAIDWPSVNTIDRDPASQVPSARHVSCPRFDRNWPAVI